MTPVEIHRGDSPIVLGLPHTGTHVPADIKARLAHVEGSDTPLFEVTSIKKEK